MTPITAPSQAAYAYDVLAPYYDDFTAGYAYERWLVAIEDRAVALGLRGRRALDVACGTGKSTAQLIARGYSVLACDISPGMIAQAQSRYPEDADRFMVADMRDLPELSEFDPDPLPGRRGELPAVRGRTCGGILVRGPGARVSGPRARVSGSQARVGGSRARVCVPPGREVMCMSTVGP